MNCERILEFIPKVLDREALDWERAAVDEHVAGCAECAAVKRELTEIGALVRAPVRAAVAEADFSSLWSNIDRGLDRVEREARASGGRRMAPVLFGRALGARLASAAAFAAIVGAALLAPLARTVPAIADNHVDVKSVEGGADQTVTVYTNPDDDVTFIWIDDNQGAKS